MIPLTSLKNIVPQNSEPQESIGIDSAEKIFDTGVIETYRHVNAVFPDRVSLNLFMHCKALKGFKLEWFTAGYQIFIIVSTCTVVA